MCPARRAQLPCHPNTTPPIPPPPSHGLTVSHLAAAAAEARGAEEAAGLEAALAAAQLEADRVAVRLVQARAREGWGGIGGGGRPAVTQPSTV